ncbi:caspase family protein [Klebsiella quasipneumoniae]|uniref:caspase family protein n=1 Tax=Klebsiella quasipneumoniae TaxID=1463165 RepID=UPI00388DFEC0
MSKRHAILISNSVYDLEDLNLETPDNDIAAVEYSLLSRGFTVDKYHNLKIQDFENIFENLRNSPKYELFFFITLAMHLK